MTEKKLTEKLERGLDEIYLNFVVEKRKGRFVPTRGPRYAAAYNGNLVGEMPWDSGVVDHVRDIRPVEVVVGGLTWRKVSERMIFSDTDRNWYLEMRYKSESV